MAEFSARREKFDLGGDGDASDGLANAGRVISFKSIINDTNEVHFKAFLTEYSDSFTTNWDEERVYGRNDPIMTFQSTNRQISLAWDVPAGSVEEGIENLQSVSLLMRMLYPSYENSNYANTIKEAPLMRVKFMNLIQAAQTPNQKIGNSDQGLLAAVSGFTFTPNIEMGFFEDKLVNDLFDSKVLLSTYLNLDYKPDYLTSQLEDGSSFFIVPRVFTLSCQLTVLHEKGLGWEKSEKTWNEGVAGTVHKEIDFSFPYADLEANIYGILGDE